MEVVTNSTVETQKIGQSFGSGLKPGNVVAFMGELGAGKTTFIQGLARGLGVKERVISPTFILMRNYEPNFYHVDLYRLQENVDMEVENLGLLDVIHEGKSIIVIEWAERIKNLLPKETIWVNIKEVGEDKREIKINR